MALAESASRFELAPSRESFSHIPEVLPLPNLIQTQTDSFHWFVQTGLRDLLDEITPITASVDEALARDILSVRVSAPLHAFHHALLKEFEWPWPSPPAGLSWHRAVRVSPTSRKFCPSRT